MNEAEIWQHEIDHLNGAHHKMETLHKVDGLQYGIGTKIEDKPYYLFSKEEIISERDRIERLSEAGESLCCCDKQLIKDLARLSMVKHKQLLKNLK